MYGVMSSREIAETRKFLAETSPEWRQAKAELRGETQAEPVRTPLAATNPRKEEPMTTPGSAAGRGTATEQWNEAIETKLLRANQMGKPIKRDAAVAAVVRERPELHKAYLAEVNQHNGHTYGVKRLSK